MSLQFLRDMASAIDRNKTKSISIISRQQVDDDTLLGRFYTGITSGKMTTDEEAFNALYPDRTERGAYYKLKNQLRQRLLNTAFFVDAKQKKWGEHGRVALENQRLVLAAYILAHIGAREASIQLMKKGMITARKYELTDDFLRAGRNVITYHAIRGNVRQVIELSEEVNSVVRRQVRELFVNNAVHCISAHYAGSRSNKPELVETITQYIREADSLPPAPDSALYISYRALLEVALTMAQHDFAAAITVGEAALHRLENYSFSYRHGMYTIIVNLCCCYLALKDYEGGERMINKILQHTSSDRLSWFKVQELRFLLAVATEKYPEARQVLLTATNHPMFNKLSTAPVREGWELFRAYLEILVLAGRLPANTGPEDKLPAFRLQRFLNSVPGYARDKRGSNVPVLIAQYFILLLTGRYDQLLDREEALAKYKDRHLDINDNYRANVFIRMLVLVSRTDLDPRQLDRITKRYRHLLDLIPNNALDSHYDQEIVPYEELWDIVLETAQALKSSPVHLRPRPNDPLPA